MNRRQFVAGAAVAAVAGTAPAGAAGQGVKFKVVNNMGTAVRVRLVHFEATFVVDIAKNAEYLSAPGEFLFKGPRAVVVFDNPTGAILKQGEKDIQSATTITLDPGGISYGAYGG